MSGERKQHQQQQQHGPTELRQWAWNDTVVRLETASATGGQPARQAQVRRNRRRPMVAPMMPITTPMRSTRKAMQVASPRGDEELAEEAVAVVERLVEAECLSDDHRDDREPGADEPCTMPSAMNGMRTNQFDAPTSFITSISRRRANVASRIVFTMRNSDDAEQHQRDHDEDPAAPCW